MKVVISYGGGINTEADDDVKFAAGNLGWRFTGSGSALWGDVDRDLVFEKESATDQDAEKLKAIAREILSNRLGL